MLDMFARLAEHSRRAPVRRHDFDWFFGGLLLALIVLCFVCTYGCAHTPCVPDVQIQEVAIPQPCIVGIEIPDPPEYLEYPAFDAENAKEWALEVERIVRTNRALRDEYINRLSELIAGHNRLEPQCK